MSMVIIEFIDADMQDELGGTYVLDEGVTPQYIIEEVLGADMEDVAHYEIVE